MIYHIFAKAEKKDKRGKVTDRKQGDFVSNYDNLIDLNNCERCLRRILGDKEDIKEWEIVSFKILNEIPIPNQINFRNNINVKQNK